MAARYNNNPRIKNVRDVEQYACIDIRQLVAEGVLIKGERSRSSATLEKPYAIYADLRQPAQAFMEIQHSGLTQTIALTWKQDSLGRSRIFFCDDTGRKVEKIYYVEGRFVSRHVGRLTFRSQSRGRTDRLIALKTPLQKELARHNVDRHLQEKERDGIASRLRSLDDNLHSIGWSMVLDPELARKRRKERRQASIERVRSMAMSMSQRASVSPEWILDTYTSVVDLLKSKACRVPWQEPPFEELLAKLSRSLDTPPPMIEAEIDLDDMRRIGLLKPGEIHARQIGWPIKWLPQRRLKIYLALDLRDAENSCAAVIFHTPRRVRTQFFWLNKYPGMFGKDAYEFECPITGRRAGRIYYWQKQFHLGSVGQRRLPRSKSNYPATRPTPSGQNPSPERMAFIRMMLADMERWGGIPHPHFLRQAYGKRQLRSMFRRSLDVKSR